MIYRNRNKTGAGLTMAGIRPRIAGMMVYVRICAFALTISLLFCSHNVLGQESTETETLAGAIGMEDYGDLLDEVYTDSMREEVNKMSLEEIIEYTTLIESVVTNPDFQSLLKYEDVRDLVIMLVHNGLDFSEEEPDLTTQILEIMGIDRNVVLVFFALLEARTENKDDIDTIMDYLKTDEGKELIGEITDTFSDEKNQELLKDFLDEFKESLAQASETDMDGIADTESMTESERTA